MADIDDKISEFAKKRKIKPEEFQQFRDSILNGMRTLGLRTDTIELDKFKEIAKKKGGNVGGNQEAEHIEPSGEQSGDVQRPG